MSPLDQSEVDALLAQAESLASEVTGQTSSATMPASPPVQTPALQTSFKNISPELRRVIRLEVPVIVQLAEREMKMQDVLELNVGSIVEFEKRFDAELDLIVTNRKIGLGHAVKVGENFGLRVTRVGPIYDTIRAMGG